MSFFMCLFLSIGLNTLLLPRVVIALAFAPTATLFEPSRLGIQAAFGPTASCQTKNHVLDLRQDVSLATCGWVDGNTANPVTCAASLYCATTSTFIGCCESSSCVGIFTTCYDLLGAACNLACQNNPQNLVCPTSLPYCALYNYEHGSVGYGCAEYSGYTSTVLLNPVTTGLGTLTGMNSSTPTSQTAYTTSATNSTTATASPSDWHGLSTGAKAGIAVGSVAVVAVICFLFYLTWSHKRKSREAARQSYTGSTTTYAASSTVHPSGEYSGTKFVFPSPKSPPWEYSSTAGDRYSTGPIEMPGESRPPHEMDDSAR